MFKKVVLTISLVVVMLVSTTGGLAQEISSAGSGELDLPEHIPGELLVRFSPGMNSVQAASKMSEMGVTHKRELFAINVHLVGLPPGLSVEQAIDRFSRQPGVEFVEPNYIYHIAATSQAEKIDQWGWNKIRTQEAWDALSADEENEVLLATVDTGIDPNQSDLSSRIWTSPGEIPNNGVDDDGNGYTDDTWGWDFVNNDNDPSDDNMHGTAVSGVMVAVEDGQGIVGVCPWCRVLAVKVLSGQGTGTLDVVADGITYAASNGAKVINLSLAGSAGSQTLQNAVDFAWNQGVVVVAAAGNDGLNTVRYPAAYANAISVASTNSLDKHSCFSNYSDGYISVAAPGEAIYVIDINNTETGYGYYSGTSLSTPFVSGLAGMLFGMGMAPENPELDNTQVRTIIEDSAVDLGLLGVDSAFGHGRVDALRAVTGDYSPVVPPEGLFSSSDTATGYAHARKLVRVQGQPGEPDTLHLIYHTQEGSTYKIKYATSTSEGSTWNLMGDVYASAYETYHPALATDGQFLFAAFPTRTGPTTNDPYEILFKRLDLSTGVWSAAQSLMGGTYNAVRPAMYYDPAGSRLHVIASSFDDSPYLYYRGSNTQGDSWDALSQFNPSNSNPRTRYAAIYAYGDNIYVATKTVANNILFTYYYLHVARSEDGGVTWIDRQQLSSFLALISAEYGLSMAGVGDRVYMGYEVGSNLYFRRNDGAGWSNYLQLEAGDASNIHKWPTITQSGDGQAWMIFEVNKQLYMRHYDGSTWEAKEPVGTGNYANFAQGTQAGKVEWLYTNCNGSPFDITYDSLSLSGNNPPVADDQDVTTAEDTAAGITLTASDLEGNPLAFNVVTNPANGTLSGTAPDLTYSPGVNFNGGDSFTFMANDGTSNSNLATVSITVTPVNDMPVADNQGVATSEDTPINITLTASDVDGDTLAYSVLTGPSHGVLSGPAPDLTYTPDPGYNGPDSFTFVANDGAADSNTATVDIYVSEVNNPPVADDQQVTTGEDSAVSITLTATDQDNDPLTYSVVFGSSNGTLSGTEPDLTYTPGADFNGQDSFTFKANDGNMDSNTATVSITVTAVNDPPQVGDQNVVTDEDTPLGITLTGSDVEGDPLTFSIVTDPAEGTLSGTEPNLTYTPGTNFNGQDSFTYKANDGSADSNTATVSIIVQSVNDPPLADDQNVGTAEDTPVAITLTGSDIEGQSLTFSLSSLPSHGFVTGTIPNLMYTPNANYNGGDSFTFQTNDGQANSNIATVSISVDPVNDPPVADDQSVTTEEDTPLAVILTASDVDGDPLTFSIQTGPANGSLSGTPPNVTYSPNSGFSGQDSFTFYANDGSLDSSPASVNITVNVASQIVDALASGEILGAGTVSGDYSATYADDDTWQGITERDSGGKPANRYSYLEHTWTFEVSPGNAITLNAKAWSSASSDGDSFTFAYSMDGVTYIDMFTIANTTEEGYESFSLPDSLQGTVFVRVTDSDHTPGNREQDTLFVDHLFIRSEIQPGNPPNAPSNLSATAVTAGQIDLSWDSDADDEMGFKIERSLDSSSWIEIATTGENETAFSDLGLSPLTTYYYRVWAFNASGSSGFSNIAWDTTLDGLSLTASGYKDKGVHVVYLEWSGGSAASFDVYRDGQEIAAGVVNPFYTDNTGYKGGASYQYQVCEAGNPQNCSNTVQVDF